MVNTLERETAVERQSWSWKVAAIVLGLAAIGLAIWAFSLNSQMSQTQRMHESMVGSHSTGPMMSMPMDSNLSGSGDQFDRNFIDAMIPHHESAVKMAQQALDKANHDEIKAMARDIISAQKREIAQLKQWRQQWY